MKGEMVEVMLTFVATLFLLFGGVVALDPATVTATTATPVPAKAPQTSFEDARCKCVCPKSVFNKTVTNRTVYIHDSPDPQSCKIQYVAWQLPDTLQALCECKFEERNTSTIKVVVIFVICVVSLLFVYMLFLLCLDPLIARRPTSYQQQANEEDEPTMSHVRPRPTRQRSIVNRVTDEQKRWKSTVQEQRKTIYDRHAMLN